MLKIRMQRIGRRHEPHFRIVVTDARRGIKSGKFVELLGSYNAKMGQIQIDGDRAKHWLSVGAQPTGTVHNFLVDQGVITGAKVNVLPQKTPIAKEQPEEPAAAPATPAVEEESEVKEEATEEPAAEEIKEETAEEAPVEEAVPAVSEEEEKTADQ